MQSKSKVPLDLDQLSALSEEALALRTVSHRAFEDGWFNTIHLLTLADGRECVIKLSPPESCPVLRYEQGLLETEVAVLRLLSSAGIPVPGVLAHLRGKPEGHDAFFMEKVPGRSWGALKWELQGLAGRRAQVPADPFPPSPAEGPRAAAALDSMENELGALSARINSIRPPRTSDAPVPWGPFRWSAFGLRSPASWSEAFLLMLDDLLLDAADSSTILPCSAAEVRHLSARFAPQLDRVREPRLVLWDLHDGNLFGLEGPSAPPSISGVLDPDRALWGDPLMEFYWRTIARSSSHFRSSWLRDVETSPLLPFEDDSVPARIALYDLYLSLVMVVECAFRGFADDHRAWALSAFSDCLGMLEKQR